MPRNIAKQFKTNMSLIHTDTIEFNYKCFYGEDVELVVSAVDEYKKPVDLTDVNVKVFYTNNDIELRQDDNIYILSGRLGVIRILAKRNFIRVGLNDVRVVIYDNDQQVHLQPATILCLETHIKDDGSSIIPDDTINVKDEFGKVKAEFIKVKDEIINVNDNINRIDMTLAIYKNALDTMIIMDDNRPSSELNKIWYETNISGSSIAGVDGLIVKNAIISDTEILDKEKLWFDV